MSSSFIIRLTQLRFFAKHGMYAEEALAGAEFEVNISLTIKAPKTNEVSLENTINYAEVYRIVTDVFSNQTALLETLAVEIAKAIKLQFPALKQAIVEIVKPNPPISAFTGSVSVTYNKKYKD